MLEHQLKIVQQLSVTLVVVLLRSPEADHNNAEAV